jgi:hypothetical protein
MQSMRQVLAAKAKLLVSFLILSGLAIAVYVLQLEETNAYAGFLPLVIDVPYVLTVLTFVTLIVGLIPVAPKQPSDFFLCVYGAFVPVPYVLFAEVIGDVEPAKFLLMFAIIVVPMIVMSLVGRLDLWLRPLGLLTNRGVVVVAVSLCACGAALSVLNAPASAGFSLESAYDRRFEARDIFTSGSLLAYIAAISVNGLVPLIAFASAATRRLWLLGASVLFAGAFFYVSGVKAPFGYLVLAYFLGLGMRGERLDAFFRAIFWPFWAAFAVFVVEQWLLGYSLSAEIGFRRVFPVPAEVMNYYYELMFGDVYPGWSPLTGIDAPDGVTFLIGEVFFANDQINVNTNAFVFGLASGGVPGYLIAIGIVAAVFGMFDALFRSTRNSLLMYAGFSFAILLVEQAATTVLLSSGLFLVAILALCLRSRRRPLPVAAGPAGVHPADLSGTVRPPVGTPSARST